MRRSLALAAGLSLALPAAAGAAPWAYFDQSTDQLGVPGALAGVEVTPEGGLYTGWAETTFRFGPGLAEWRQPQRTLEEDRWPVLTSVQRRDGVAYTLTVFADEVGGRPVTFARVVMRGEPGGVHVGRFAAGVRATGGALKSGGAVPPGGALRRFRFLRPVAPARIGSYEQPGAVFSPTWKYAFRGDTLTRDGAVVLTVPPGSARRLRPDGPGPVTAGTVFGEAGVRVRLAPGATASVEYRMPVEPVPAADPVVQQIQRASFTARRRGVVAAWRKRLAGAMTIEVPEAKVRNAYTASLVNILTARSRTPDGDWMQAVNKLNYQAFWLRDAAMLTNALDRVGLFAPAGENLPFFARSQQPDGLFISRAGQYDGMGQALWAIGEHALRSGDDALGRAWLPRLDAAVDWIARVRSADRFGLLPPGDPRDNELVAGRLAGDDFWAVTGLEAAVALARRLGEDARATAWQQQLDGLRSAVRVAVGTDAIRPALDVPGGTDWGNLWAAWPGSTLDADAPAVTKTIARSRADFQEGIATWSARKVLHGYLGFRVFQTELERGEQAKVVDGLYASLAHTSATHGGFETGIRPFGGRAVDDNLVPHGWFAAEYVHLLRNMLVREVDGGGVELGSALAPGWLRPGRRVRVTRAPVLPSGSISYTLRAGEAGAVLTWTSTAPAGTPLRWRVPAGVSEVRAPGLQPGANVVALPGREGRLQISWRPPSADGASFARTTRALTAAYRKRGLEPPTGSPGGS